MSMGTIGKALKATRVAMIESEADSVAGEFLKHFGCAMAITCVIAKRVQGGSKRELCRLMECFGINVGAGRQQ